MYVQVIQKHLKDRLLSFAEQNWTQRDSAQAIVSAVAIAILVHKYHIELTFEQQVGLLSAMALQPDAAESTCSGYARLEAEFHDPRYTVLVIII